MNFELDEKAKIEIQFFANSMNKLFKDTLIIGFTLDRTSDPPIFSISRKEEFEEQIDIFQFPCTE